MKKKPYSKILDAVARDHLPVSPDLTPAILARIQKGKANSMQPNRKFFFAVLTAAAALVVLFFTVPEVAAAFSRWFGYVPGVGLVSEGQIRVLAEPVSVTREGITVTVDQVVINQEQTALIYSVEGVFESGVTAEGESFCPYIVTLHPAGGGPLLASPNGSAGWETGYQHRFNYAPIPAAVNEATLEISCLYLTLPGAAPEDWSIPLKFVPAAGEVTAYPVIEIPSAIPTLPATKTDPTLEPTGGPVEGDTGISLTFDRAVVMDSGVLLYAVLDWSATDYASVDLSNAGQAIHLYDGEGQEIPFEQVYDEQTGVNWDGRQTVFAIQTIGTLPEGPMTLVVDRVLAEVPVEETFEFDAAAIPHPGQAMQPDQRMLIGARSLRVTSILAEPGGYTVEMASEDGIRGASCADMDRAIAAGSSGEGSESEDGLFSFGCSFFYADGTLPQEIVTITVGSIAILHEQTLQAEWSPPMQ